MPMAGVQAMCLYFFCQASKGAEGQTKLKHIIVVNEQWWLDCPLIFEIIPVRMSMRELPMVCF